MFCSKGSVLFRVYMLHTVIPVYLFVYLFGSKNCMTGLSVSNSPFCVFTALNTECKSGASNSLKLIIFEKNNACEEEKTPVAEK